MYVKYDLALFSQDTRFIDRCKRICEKFGYVFKHFDNTSQFVTEHTEYRLIAIAGMEFPNGGELSAFLSTVKTGAPDAFLLFVEHAKGVENAITIAKSFGCDLTLKEGEFFDTSKPEFICSQVIRATYLPIKSTDISSGKVLTFDLYHFMPQREKFLKFCFEGDQIDPKKLEKLKSVDEVYIHRDQAAKFATYMTVGANTTNAEEMNRRCRGQFIAFYASYTNFVFQITDQSGEKTFQAGLDLLKKCKALAMDLLVTLATHPDPWNIISKATVGDFGSLERAPAVAAYAGIIGTLMGIDQTEDLMVSALLSELGILLLPEPIMDHIRKGTVDQLTEEQLKIYNNYPMKSISIVLDKKVQMDDRLRNIISSTHERADKKGFPGKKFGTHIPVESYIIHFAFEIDQRTAARLGKPRMDLAEGITSYLTEEMENPAHFTLQFVLKLKVALKSKLAIK